MVRKARRALTVVPLLLAALALGAGAARAEVNRQASDAAWKLADQCSREAVRKFPDYTPASLAQRAASRRQCLRDHKLPEASAPTPASGSQSGGQSGDQP